MDFSTLLAMVTGPLATSCIAVYVVTYPEHGCAGDTYDINVYDNTCHAPAPAIMSFKVTAYGADGQYLKWYSDGECTRPGEMGCEGVGSSGGYPLQQCHEIYATDVSPDVSYGLASFAVKCQRRMMPRSRLANGCGANRYYDVARQGGS